MTYYQFEITIEPFEPWSEILAAYLGELYFEGFYEKENTLYAFVAKEHFEEKEFLRILKRIQDNVNIDYSFSELPQQNWNALWESNFEPVFIENELAILAPFHEIESTFKRKIIIEPKMSFGTGHHQTTYMMCEAIMKADLKGKQILDMGSGTGVLAILAELEGALDVLAVDIEPWSVENCARNASDNKCRNITSILGDIDAVAPKTFDVIFANINKNILLRHLPDYVLAMNQNGLLYLSGFFASDAHELNQASVSLGLCFSHKEEREGWCMLVFKK